MSPPGTSLLSGELLVEQGCMVDVPVLLPYPSHGSISCAPQGWFTSRKLKLVSSNLPSCLFVHSEHIYLGISKHIGSKNLPRFPSDETAQKHPVQSVHMIFKGCLTGLGMAPPNPQPSFTECLYNGIFSDTNLFICLFAIRNECLDISILIQRAIESVPAPNIFQSSLSGIIFL